MMLLNSQSRRVAMIASSALVLAFAAAASAVSTAHEVAAETVNSPNLFVPNSDAIPFDDSRRRKWDSPVIADVDQDGLQDIIITEHGNEVLILWNNGGTYSEPQKIAGGDLHGVAVADFDRDGVMDVIIAQGGGDGANPRRPLWLRFARDRSIVSKETFDYFEKGRGRSVKFVDPDEDGVLDLLITGFPTPEQKAGANHLYRNIGDGKFEFVGNLPQAKWLGYRAATMDIDGDHTADLVFYGGANMRAVQGGDSFSFADQSEQMFGALANTSDVANIVQIDFDNDGDFDLFLPRAEHQFDLESYYDPSADTFAFLTFRKPFLHDGLKVEGDLIIENLQRTFPHFNIYLGKDGRKLPEVDDRHAGRDLVIKPEEAMGWPEGETKAGFYIGYMGDGTWRIGGQSQSRLAGVIRNVTAAKAGEPQKPLPARLFENRDGRFVDVTESLGIAIAEQTTSATSGDFNNDGWADLAILRYGDMARINTHILYLNRGGKSFEKVENHGIIASNLGTTGGAIEAFDYNSDGALDLIFTSERGSWNLLENRFPALGNFVVVRVGKSPSGRALAAGAKLTINACGQTYQRVVNAGSAAFSQSMNAELHVGLGKCDVIDDAQVVWTTGETAPVTVTINGIVEAGS